MKLGHVGPDDYHPPGMSGWTVFCDVPSAIVELSRRCAALDRTIDVHPFDLDEAHARRERGEKLAWVALEVPSDESLARLATVQVAAVQAVQGSTLRAPIPIVLSVPGADLRELRRASALGIVALDELAPTLACWALLELDLQPPFSISDRALEVLDRRRIEGSLDARRGPDALVPDDDGVLALVRGETRTRLGRAPDVARALDAIRRVAPDPRPAMPRVEGVEPRAVLDVILGPPRELSDPASKAALAVYDVPLPLEEVCASPSRASSEAGRIGFPVRIALASPDLRLWDHPDLVAEGVENAARARDVFRQVMSLARARAPEARLLGVTVSATSAASALLHVDLRRVADHVVLAELAFGDPHGLASADRTHVALPCTPANLERALEALAGVSLLLPSTHERRARVSALGDALLRVAAFLHDWPAEVSRVRLRPLAVLVDGSVEIREASVLVSDAFERSLR